MNFYLSNNGETVGPYSVEQIQIFLRQGLVTTSDQVWADGWADWMAIGNVPGLGFHPSKQRENAPANDIAQLEDSFATNEVERGQPIESKAASESMPDTNLLPDTASLNQPSDETDLKENHAKEPATVSHQSKNRSVEKILVLPGICFSLVAICWIIGASYNVGVQKGAQAGVQAGFKQGVHAGAEAQSQQDIQTVDNVESTVNAVRDQQDQNPVQDQNQDTSNPASQLYNDENGQIRARPLTAPQSFDNN